MAGRVLRDSKGRYAGSTKGWGRGRSTHGGGFGNRKGKVRSVAANNRRLAFAKAGKAIGTQAGKMAIGTVAGLGATALGRRAGLDPNRVAVAAMGGYAAYAATRQVIKRSSRG